MRGLGVVVLVFAAGCGAEPPAEKKARPAELQRPGSETELLKLTLTDEAVGRLGIETAAVERRAVARTRTYGGELVVPPGREVTVTAPLAGTLRAPARGGVPAPGSWLRPGQDVLALEPLGPAQDDPVRREAEAATRHEAAAAEAVRAEQLLRDRAGSQKRVDEARAALALAEAELRSARAQRDLFDGRVKTPLGGRLGSIAVTTGQIVAAGVPLFVVVADDPLWVRVPVYVGDLAGVELERAASVRVAGWDEGGAGRQAEPVAAPPSANPAAATADLFYRLANAEHTLRPGQRVAVTLELRPEGGPGGRSEPPLALVVPRQAVLYDIHGGTWLYRNPAPLEFVRSRIEVSRIEGELAVLSRGPEVGTVVVTFGATELFGAEFGIGK